VVTDCEQATVRKFETVSCRNVILTKITANWTFAKEKLKKNLPIFANATPNARIVPACC